MFLQRSNVTGWLPLTFNELEQVTLIIVEAHAVSKGIELSNTFHLTGCFHALLFIAI